MAPWLAEFIPQSPEGLRWLALGLVGQLMFFSRWLVQWWVSERNRASVMPGAFWWLSLIGAALVLAYGLKTREPVLVVGQSVGFTVYFRNLLLRRNVESHPS